MLAGASSGCDRWKWAGGNAALSPAEAIAAVAADVLSGEGTSARPAEPVLIIPDGCTGAQQQEVLDAARRMGLRVRLLWRPVAAAMEWCRHFHEHVSLREPAEGKTVGQILCLHLGLDGVEATRLKIVLKRSRDDQLCLVPARPRPKCSAVAGFGLTFVEKLAERATSACIAAARAEVGWRLLWSTPWLPASLARMRGHAPPDAWHRVLTEAGFPESIWQETEAWLSTYASMDRASDGPRHGIGCITSWSPRDVADWVAGTLKIDESREEPLIGAVVTGPLAGIAHGTQTIGLQWLGKANCPFNLVLCEGRDQPQGLLARAAALYATRLEAGLPTYLDTLPRLEVVVTRCGEPTWQSLLQEDESFVDGGKPFQKEGVGLGEMCIESGSTALGISLHHEEHATVREHIIALPRAPNDRMPISLDVSMTPAQGNARIEIKPSVVELFGPRNVVVDWKGNMRESGKVPEEYLQDLPRILPSASPRGGSRLMWGGGTDLWGRLHIGAAARMSEYLARPSLIRLNDVTKSLQIKDRSIEPGEYTAVSSDGDPGRNLEDARELLHRFVQDLVQRLGRNTQLDEDQVVRALTYTSTANRIFADYMRDRIDREGPRMARHNRAACGWCLREPAAIAQFAFATSGALRRGAGPNVWIKSLWEILRYREDATRDMSSELCLDLADDLLSIFHSEMQALSFRLNFRYASGGVAYLLRRRRYDTAYLDPNSQRARILKSAFQQAISLVGDHPANTIGGFIKIDDQLRLIIDYIDLRGHGPIMI